MKQWQKLFFTVMMCNLAHTVQAQLPSERPAQTLHPRVQMAQGKRVAAPAKPLPSEGPLPAAVTSQQRQVSAPQVVNADSLPSASKQPVREIYLRAKTAPRAGKRF